MMEKIQMTMLEMVQKIMLGVTWLNDLLARGASWVIMQLPGDVDPKIKGVLAVFLAVIMMVALAFLFAGVAYASDHYQVIGVKCDKHGGVDGLQIAVREPTVLTLTWDNAKICGKGV